jgi:MFS family permease
MGVKRFGATGGVLGLLCLMYLITYVDRVNVSTAAPVFQKELGLSNLQVGLVFSMFAYPYLAFQVFGGWLGDKFGARRTLVACGIIWAAATIATGLVGGLTTLLIARFFLGFGEGATFPTATRAMSNWTAPSQRGFAQGITHSFSRFGNAITPPIVAWLILAVSWRFSFVVIGLVSLVWVLVWAYYFRDDPREHRGITQAEIDRLPPYVARREQAAIPWAPLFRRMLPVTLVYFCYGWTLWLFLSWLPSFFMHSYNMNLKDSAIFAAGVFFAGVLGDTAGGLISDWLVRRTGNLRLGRCHMVMVCMLLALGSLLPVMFVHDALMAAVALSLGFFFAELTIGPMWAIPMDIAPKFSGTASGIMNMGSAFAAIVSPVIGGWIIDATGDWNLPFVGSIGLLVAGALLTLSMHPERPLQTTEKLSKPVLAM